MAEFFTLIEPEEEKMGKVMGMREFLLFFLLAVISGCDSPRSNPENVWTDETAQALSTRPLPLIDFPVKSTIYVSDFGAFPDDMEDDLEGTLRAIEAAMALQKPAKVEFEPGLYRMKTERDQTSSIVLDGAQNLILDGNGAEIIIQNPTSGFIDVVRGKNVIIKNISIDYDPLPFTQGIVKGVNLLTGSVIIDILEGFPLLNEEHFLHSKTWDFGPFEAKKGILKDKEHPSRLKNDVPNMTISIHESHMSGRRFRINVTPYYAQYFKKDDHYVHLARGGPPVLKATDSNQVTFKNVTVYTGPGTAYLSGGSTLVNLIDCKTITKGERWHSTCADGIIAYRNRIGPWIENCTFEGTGDDSININTSGGVCVDKIDDRTFVIGGRLDHRGIRQGYGVQEQDLLRVFDPKYGRLLGEGRVMTVIPDPEAGTFLVTLSNDILGITPGESNDAPIFYNDNTVGAHFVIKNNTFRNTRRYGVLCQSHDGIIENNQFEGVSGNAILLMNTIHSGSGFAPYNILIRGNRMENCYIQKTMDRGDAHAAIIGAIIEKNGYEPAKWQGIENVLIQENTIINWKDVDAVRISNARNVIVDNNLFETTIQVPWWQWWSPYPISLENLTDVFITNNKVIDNRLTSSDIVDIGANTTNVVTDKNQIN